MMHRTILLTTKLLLFLTVGFAQELYSSEHLLINKISDHTFQHISYLTFDNYGKVPCNGMVIANGNEAIIIDTPTEDSATMELINWIEQDLHCNIKTVIPTHFHEDCLGGLHIFHEKGIPSYANQRTIQFAEKSGASVPQNNFYPFMEFEVGDKTVMVEFVGEGHTRDNVIVYFPDDTVLFGGCLVKSMGAGKGNLEDANIEKWSESVSLIKEKYPDLTIVIPGHGNPGGIELLDYTSDLFK